MMRKPQVIKDEELSQLYTWLSGLLLEGTALHYLFYTNRLPWGLRRWGWRIEGMSSPPILLSEGPGRKPYAQTRGRWRQKLPIGEKVPGLEGTQVQGLTFPPERTSQELEWFLLSLPTLLWHCTTELYNCIFVPVGSWNIRAQCIIPGLLH